MTEHIVNLSGGKDSTAMLLRLLELGMRVDRVVFADTGFEFPELYEYLKRVEDYTHIKIEFLYPTKTFEEWFSGELTRGKKEGEPRGMPQVLTPCYWSRESKIVPLEKVQQEAEVVYVGIAFDEQHRMMKEAGKIKYPLVDWGWTEQDCVDYLNKKKMFNPLYVNFNRLGCWLCPQQSTNSLYVLWKNYPELWSKLKALEGRNLQLTGRNIFLRPLKDIELSFENGKVPKKLPKYECWDGCEAVKKAYREKQTGLTIYNFCGSPREEKGVLK